MEALLTNKMDFESEIISETNVIVVNPIRTTWSLQLTSEASLRALRHSNRVTWLDVSSYEPKKYFINKNDFISSLLFRNPIKRIKTILSREGIEVRTKFKGARRNIKVSEDFKSLDALRDFRFDNVPIGAIVYSAVSSVKHSTSISMVDDKRLIDHFLRYTSRVFFQLEREFTLQKPDIIISINDRLPGSAIAVALASKLDIPIRIIYWGSSPSKVIDYKDSLYDPNQWQALVKSKWESTKPNSDDCETLKRLLADFTIAPSVDSLPFLQRQVKGKGITKSNFTVVFYAQSEHEHSPTYLEKIENRFKDQYTAFENLESVCETLQIDLILKLHPNRFDSESKLDSNAEQNEWLHRISSKTKVIPKNSDIDTYQLIYEADLNVVWNSAVGIESIARGRPTLVMGNAQWLDLDWDIHAWDSADLMHKMKKKDWNLNPQNLLPWFWYIKDFGVNCEFALLERGLTINNIQVIRKRLFIRFYHLTRSSLRVIAERL